MITKRKETNCGPACIEYIASLENLKIEIDNQEVWCCNLANVLSKFFKVQVKCFNSRLLVDAKKILDSRFEGFCSIRSFLKSNQILEEKLDIETLKKEIQESEYVICNVASREFHENEQMNGGHYIIVLSCNFEDVNIVNPREKDFEITTISADKLLLSMQQFGSWRILLK